MEEVFTYAGFFLGVIELHEDDTKMDAQETREEEVMHDD